MAMRRSSSGSESELSLVIASSLRVAAYFLPLKGGGRREAPGGGRHEACDQPGPLPGSLVAIRPSPFRGEGSIIRECPTRKGRGEFHSALLLSLTLSAST